MEEKLLKNSGEYNYSEFYGKDNVIFKIIGTKAPINAKDCLSCLDTFITKNGTVLEIKRHEILDKVIKGFMKPVLSSAIKAQKTYAKKDWDKLTGRVQ